jgi:hypothetical protein
MANEKKEKDEKTAATESSLEKVKESLDGLQFGSVLISVQDGKIVQIDKNEKFRLK